MALRRLPRAQLTRRGADKDTMNYVRAVLQSGELSERVLALTEDAIDLNPANYTVWHLRRRCIKALGKPLEAELAYVQMCAEDSPKNYQIWCARRTPAGGGRPLTPAGAGTTGARWWSGWAAARGRRTSPPRCWWTTPRTTTRGRTGSGRWSGLACGTGSWTWWTVRPRTHARVRAPAHRAARSHA